MGKRPDPMDQPEPVARFANAFRELVDATRMPLERLGTQVKKSASALSDYQNGKRQPSEDLVLMVHELALRKARELAKPQPFTVEEIKHLLANARAARHDSTDSEELASAAEEHPKRPMADGTEAEPHAKNQQTWTRQRRPGTVALVALTLVLACAGLGGIAAWTSSSNDTDQRLGGAAAPSSSSTTPQRRQPSPPTSTARRVCAETLLVRSAPKAPSKGARRVGTLRTGDSFDVERYSSDRIYAYGFAHGQVRKHGWIDAQWLCAPGESPPTGPGNG